ncbi:hypothetical protein TNCV_2270011 [Trichonephila clavipes]|nr:hypothetical protein TNCV_2270011 [Trichonephila clavipes]
MLEKVIVNWTSRLDYIRASRGSHMPEIIFKIPEGPELAKNGHQVTKMVTSLFAKPPKWSSTCSPKITPTWLYRQDFTKVPLNHRYNQTKFGCISDPTIKQQSSERKQPSSPTPKTAKTVKSAVIKSQVELNQENVQGPQLDPFVQSGGLMQYYPDRQAHVCGSRVKRHLVNINSYKRNPIANAISNLWH